MPVQHTFKPKHLALAIALTVCCVESSVAQQAEEPVVTAAEGTKTRKRLPKKVAPALPDAAIEQPEPFVDLFEIPDFIGPMEHTRPAINEPREDAITRLPVVEAAKAVVEFDDAFYEFLEFPEPETGETEIAELDDDSFDEFQNAYTTQISFISQALENVDGVSLQLGEADDLLVINNGARWEGRLDGGAGKNGLLLNASEGGEIGATANFAGLRVARGKWQLHDEFQGSAEVQAGASLLNNGSIEGDAYVDESAVYGGNGKVSNLYVQGALVANTEIGSPIVKGNLEFTETATYSYGVTADQFSTPVLVEGTATLANASVQVFAAPGDYANSATHPILFAGKIDGEFGRVSTNLAFLTPTLSYTDTAVALTYKRNDLALERLAGSASGQALARSVDTPMTATLNTAVQALVSSTRASAPIAIEQLAGSSNANLAKATLSSLTPVSKSMLSAMHQLNTRPGTTHGSASSPRQAAGAADTGRVWVQALGHGGKVDHDADSTLKHATQGLVIGADWRLDEQWHVGLIGGKSQTKLDARQYDGDLDSWHLGAYAVRQDGPMALRLGATYASHAGSSKRRVAFNDFSDRLKGAYDVNTQQAFAELGFNLGRNNVTLEPFAGLGFQRYQRDSYSEKGGDAALRVFGQTRANLSSTFGVRVAKTSFLDNGMRLTPRLSTGWKHTFGEIENDTRQQLVKGGKRFDIAGAALDRNSLSVDAGLDLGLSANHTLGVGVTGEMGTDSRTHGVVGQWRMAF